MVVLLFTARNDFKTIKPNHFSNLSDFRVNSQTKEMKGRYRRRSRSRSRRRPRGGLLIGGRGKKVVAPSVDAYMLRQALRRFGRKRLCPRRKPSERNLAIGQFMKKGMSMAEANAAYKKEQERAAEPPRKRGRKKRAAGVAKPRRSARLRKRVL